jgi:hypothetical protein
MMAQKPPVIDPETSYNRTYPNMYIKRHFIRFHITRTFLFPFLVVTVIPENVRTEGLLSGAFGEYVTARWRAESPSAATSTVPNSMSVVDETIS